jgi:hypothetical protein
LYDVLFDVLAFVGAVSCVMWLVKAIKALAAKKEGLSEDDATDDPASGDIAAIMAAIYAIVGPCRIVGIEEQEEPASDVMAAITAAIQAVVGSHRIVGIEVEEPASDDLAAIMAAMYAVLGPSHRIVGIEDANNHML